MNANQPNEAGDDEMDPLDCFLETMTRKAPIKTLVPNIDPNSEDEENHSKETEEADIFKMPNLLFNDNSSNANTEKEEQNTRVVLNNNFPLKKNIYIESKELSNLTAEQVDAIRDTLGNITVHGINVCCPIEKWSQCGLPNQIMCRISKLNYVRPTPIQCQSIPCILSGRDVIGCAITGSGKTLAFVLPSILHILAQIQIAPLRQSETLCVFMSPTRELAIQTHDEASKYLKLLDLRSACLVGGNDVDHQLRSLKNGVHIIVGTPGRVIDVMNTMKTFNFGRVGFFCIDEADRMFDMGFEPQVMKIANAFRRDRQTVMFSATFPHIVERAARKLLTNPVEIVVGVRNTVSPNIDQHIEILKAENKFNRLLMLLGHNEDKGQSLIFLNTQDHAEHLFGRLIEKGYRAALLHAGLDQSDRASILHDFRNGIFDVLVLTSVGSRGLDIMSISLVINYDAPDHGADYVHRLGRTGRAGNKGSAYTFIEPQETSNALEIMMAMKKGKSKIPKELEEMCKSVQTKRTLTGFSGHGFRFDKTEFDKIQEERKQVAKEDKKEASKNGNASDNDDDDDDDNDNDDNELDETKTDAIKETKDGNYMIEFVINDYSAHTRMIMQKKETIDQVTDVSGATIIQRGTFCVPGTKPPIGEKKLYFLIEGPTMLSVDYAVNQFKRIANESDSAKQAPQTKYKVT